MGGAGDIKAGLPNICQVRVASKEAGKEAKKPYIDVPHMAAGLPIMILSETPAISSLFPKAEASNK